MEDITSVLPEECIAKIISKTSPSDACRLSLVSTAFSSAAASNLVWEGFLPPDYQHIISESVSSASSQTSPLNMLSKKDLYFSLCHNPILIGNGNRSFAIHKWSGKKCYMLGARQIDIAWGDTSQYWKWTSLGDSPILPKSRFPAVAHLVRVCWLEITGRVQTKILSPYTTYGAYLIYTIANSFQGLGVPVKVSVGYIDGCQEGRFPSKREDMWMEIEMGEFFNHGQDSRVVDMRLGEFEFLNWKSGLVIHGIELRPKEKR
ncbi:F-box protein At2g02240-like [Carya illinoinensis]|nr:F-box protein At2g02240-like [Carya illinoinensis]